MKRIISLYVILNVSSFLAAFSQINLIRDGIFDETSFKAEKSITDFPETKGEWFPYIEKDESMILSVTADEHQGTVMNIQTTSTPATKSFVGQRIKSLPAPAIYTVAFSAKTLEPNTKPNIVVCLKIQTENKEEEIFFEVVSPKEISGDTTPRHLKFFQLSNFWEYYAVNFDLNKVIKTSAHNANETTVEKSTEEYLEDFYIAFSCTESNTRIRITEVSMSIAKE